MSYSRFSDKSDWYLWWDVYSGTTKDTQILAIAHVTDIIGECVMWPRYFTYKQLKYDLESCLIIYRLCLGTRSGIKFTKLRRYIKLFIEDVERDYRLADHNAG